jgi:hypothetical protein
MSSAAHLREPHRHGAVPADTENVSDSDHSEGRPEFLSTWRAPCLRCPDRIGPTIRNQILSQARLPIPPQGHETGNIGAAGLRSTRERRWSYRPSPGLREPARNTHKAQCVGNHPGPGKSSRSKMFGPQPGPTARDTARRSQIEGDGCGEWVWLVCGESQAAKLVLPPPFGLSSAVFDVGTSRTFGSVRTIPARLFGQLSKYIVAALVAGCLRIGNRVPT